MFKKYDEFINEASMDNFQMYLTKLADHLGDRQLARDAKTRSYLKSMFKKDKDYEKFTDDEVKNLSGEELHNMIKYDKRFNEGVNEALARGLKPLLKIGTTITKNDGEDALLDLSDKFDSIDDEYAGTIASHLDMAIELMQDGYPADATKMLKQFNKKCKDVLKGKTVKSVFAEGVNEAKVTAKTIDKLTNEIAELTKKLKDNFKKYKAAKTIGDKEAYMRNAGKLTKEKKIKDSELEMAIQNFGADMELDMNFESKVNEAKAPKHIKGGIEDATVKYKGKTYKGLEFEEDIMTDDHGQQQEWNYIATADDGTEFSVLVYRAHHGEVEDWDWSYLEANESVKVNEDHGGESKMAKSQLYKVANYGQEIHDMLADDMNLPEWVESKITKAADYLGSVKHYLEYEMKTGNMFESKIDIALNKMDKWLPEDPDAMERYYEIINQESWREMKDFFIEYGNEDVLQGYGLQMKDMTKLAKAAMESYGPITAQRLNESTNRIL